jgi:hypothetical protein
MNDILLLSAATRTTAGILLLTIVAVESGGLFMLRVLGGKQAATPFQKAFYRAGHAHAGVLVILSLVAQIYADATGLIGLAGWLGRSAIPLAAILMPAGFFFAAMGREATKPNRFILLVYAGALSLAVGVVSLGVGLLTAG